MKLITIFAAASCVFADEPNGYPTYAPTVYETYSPTVYETYSPTRYETYAPTRYETYAPTQGDDDEYTTDVPTGTDTATLMPVTGSPVVAATTEATTTTTLATTTTSTIVTTTTATTATTAATTISTTTLAAVPVPVCPATLDKSMIIDEKATFHYAIVSSNPPLAKNGILCGRLEANNGDGWIAFGVSTDGQMVGSEAIIGVPEDATVLKYNLMSKTQSGVIPMPAEKQTLSDVSIISEDEGMTIMTFTKFLYEDDEIPILIKGVNTFLHARGANTFGYHYNGRMSFTIDFSDESVAGTKSDGQSFIEGGGFIFSEGNAAQTKIDSASNGSAAAVTCTSLLTVLVLGTILS